MWENSKTYWGVGNQNLSDSIGIVSPEIGKYTDYQPSTAQKINTTANIITDKIDEVATTVGNDVKSIYDYAKYYPIFIMGAGLVVLLSYGNLKNIKKAIA